MQQSLSEALVEANMNYSQAVRGGQSGTLLRDMEDAAASYLTCKQKLMYVCVCSLSFFLSFIFV